MKNLIFILLATLVASTSAQARIQVNNVRLATGIGSDSRLEGVIETVTFWYEASVGVRVRTTDNRIADVMFIDGHSYQGAALANSIGCTVRVSRSDNGRGMLNQELYVVSVESCPKK